MSQRKSETERYDPTQPPYEAYKIDFELFRIMFGGLSPWGKCTQAESLAARLFRVSFFFAQNITARMFRQIIDIIDDLNSTLKYRKTKFLKSCTV